MKTDGGQEPVLELFFSSDAESEEETQGDKKIIWKDCLREGDFAMTPGLGGKQRKSFSVIPDGNTDWDNRIISMGDIENAFNEKAFEHVTIPTRHEDRLLDNTGFTQALRRKVKKVDGKDVTFLQAGLGFTEPDVAGKVRRGTIPNVSCGLFGNFERKADGKKFPVALKHVALTHTPWINKLDSFPAVFASDDEVENAEELEIEGYAFADEEGEDDGAEKGEVIWNENKSFNWMREEVQTALRPSEGELDSEVRSTKPNYYVQDVSADNNALVEEYFRGDRNRYVIPFNVKEDGVEIAPATRWVAVKEAMIAASDDSIAENFDDHSISRLEHNLDERLADIYPDLQLEDITFDNRARIIHKETKSKWIARFSVDREGGVEVEPSADWVRISDPEPSKTGENPPSPSKPDIKLSDKPDSPEGRLKAAAERRRQVAAS